MSINEDFNRIMKTEIEREAKMSNEKHDELFDKYSAQRVDYANAGNNTEGKKTKTEIERGLEQDGQGIIKDENFRKNIAEIVSNVDEFGDNPTGKLGELTDDVVNIVSGRTGLTYKDEQPGYETSKGWQSADKIEEVIKSGRVDKASRSGIKALVEDSMRKAETIQPGENSEFNYKKEYDNIKNKIINTGNLKSLATDKIFGDRVFKDDLQSAITMGSYKEMGLTEEQLFALDPTKDGKITKEDAATITSHILDNEDMLKDYLAEYYTNAVEQNFNNNLSTEIQTKKKEDDPYEFVK